MIVPMMAPCALNPNNSATVGDIIAIKAPTIHQLTLTGMARYQDARSGRWNMVFTLNDGSVWRSILPFGYLGWAIGDPVFMVKDTPWRGKNTHSIIHFNKNAQPRYKRLGARRIYGRFHERHIAHLTTHNGFTAEDAQFLLSIHR